MAAGNILIFPSRICI